MNKVTRGEKVLQRLVDQGQISSCGRDWLIAAVDPFHDKQLANLRGWPDLESGSSVIRCIKQSMTITVPTFVPAGTNWDCHIVQWPWLNGSGTPLGTGSFAVSVTRQGQVFQMPLPIVNSGQVGGLQAYGCTAGTNMNIVGTGNGTSIGRLDIDPQFTQGAGRLVGMGFEVHNTTSQLNVQGACAVWRQMALNPSANTWQGFDATNYTFSGTPVRFPPKNLAESLLLQGSRQWEAREGCYVVSAFNDADNPAKPIQPTAPVIMGSLFDDLEGAVATTPINYPIPGPAVGISGLRPVQSYRVHPIHQSGAIFSGLSYTTSLVVNWNVYYESFPALSQIEILPLAAPSCEYDPDALDLFERILQDLPVGVKVKENGLGDWFMGAVSDAAKFISPLLKVVPTVGPGLSAIADYVGTSMASARDQGRSENQSPWNPPQKRIKAKTKNKTQPPNQQKQKQKNQKAPARNRTGDVQ